MINGLGVLGNGVGGLLSIKKIFYSFNGITKYFLMNFRH
jgi:hypothetical protein